ncbi:hypothetical protein PQX77_021518 [Marasmius sp. AFHP31]|nr:hypothetical protein PQX77_021518 [Marasmius sp. AFHP31]
MPLRATSDAAKYSTERLSLLDLWDKEIGPEGLGSHVLHSLGRGSGVADHALADMGKLTEKDAVHDLRSLLFAHQLTHLLAATNMGITPSVPTPTESQVTTDSPINTIEKFAAKVDNLPSTIPEAKEGDAFSVYANDAETYTVDIPHDKIWPTFDGLFTKLIPSSDKDSWKHLVSHGKYRLPAFVRLIQHLKYNCKMDTAFLEPKLKRLMETINWVVAIVGKAPKQPSAQCKKPKDPSTEVVEAPGLSKKLKGLGT